MFKQESIYFTLSQVFQYDGGLRTVRFTHDIGSPEYSWDPRANMACGTVTVAHPNSEDGDPERSPEQQALAMFARAYGLGLRAKPEFGNDTEDEYLAFFGFTPSMPRWGLNPVTPINTTSEFGYIHQDEYGTRTITWRKPLWSAGTAIITSELRKAVVTSGTGDTEYFDSPAGQDMLLDVMTQIVEDQTPKEFTTY